MLAYNSQLVRIREGVTMNSPVEYYKLLYLLFKLLTQRSVQMNN